MTSRRAHATWRTVWICPLNTSLEGEGGGEVTSSQNIFQIRLDQSESSNHHPERKYEPFNC